jgi:hypothetical protein
MASKQNHHTTDEDCTSLVLSMTFPTTLLIIFNRFTLHPDSSLLYSY